MYCARVSFPPYFEEIDSIRFSWHEFYKGRGGSRRQEEEINGLFAASVLKKKKEKWIAMQQMLRKLQVLSKKFVQSHSAPHIHRNRFLVLFMWEFETK